MNQNSNIRHIDELGRIVIPKDIRKKLHILDNEPLEIYIDDGKIHIQKYSSLVGGIDDIKFLVDAAKRITDNDYIICDKEKILASTIPELIEERIDTKLADLIIHIKKINNEKRELLFKDKIINAYYNILPIITDNDRMGLIFEIKDRELYNDYLIRFMKSIIEKS